MLKSFKETHPKSYHRIVKELYCQEVGMEFQEYFCKNNKDKSRKNSTVEQDITEAKLSSLYQLIEFIGLERNVVEEGIFRKPGSKRKENELLERIDRGEVGEELLEGEFTAHECASVLKKFLANLPEPLVTTACYKAHLAVAEIQDYEARLEATQLILELIPQQYFRLLKDLLFLLNGVAERAEENKMTASNLGIMFSNHILSPKHIPPLEQAASQVEVARATTFMIENPTQLFTLSDELLAEVEKLISRSPEPDDCTESRVMEDLLKALKTGSAFTRDGKRKRQLEKSRRSSAKHSSSEELEARSRTPSSSQAPDQDNNAD